MIGSWTLGANQDYRLSACRREIKEVDVNADWKIPPLEE
jgi:hypothetical protein